MAKDERLWMRFPIDMHRDPKVTRLSDAAFRVFFQMNGEARLEANDGVFTKEDAEFRWPAELLAELVKSHPTEPLVVASGDAYRLRRYAKHQFTEADREALADKRAEAGKAGAAKRWGAKSMANDGNPIASATGSHGKAMANDGKAWQAIAESESESEIDLDPSNTKSVSPVSNRARNLGLTDKVIGSIVQTLDTYADIRATREEAEALAAHVIELSPTVVTYPGAYVRRAIEDNPTETGQWFTRHRKRGNAA